MQFGKNHVVKLALGMGAKIALGMGGGMALFIGGLDAAAFFIRRDDGRHKPLAARHFRLCLHRCGNPLLYEAFSF